MGEAVERSAQLIESGQHYNIPFEEIRVVQVDAMNERLQERKAFIKLVGHLARKANLTGIRCLEKAVPLLLPHRGSSLKSTDFL